MKTRKWDPLRYLEDEESIALFLRPNEDEEETEDFRLLCFETAIRARAINQLAQKTGISRDVICEMFISGKGDLGILANLQTAFAVEPVKELVQV